MDFDEAKENIQPLAQGRNPSILQASIKVDSHQELLAQRKELEREIHNYTGEDPLSAWFTYIEWIEQSFPSGGKESGLQEVLAKCLSRFESDERYFQDRRMIKLYIKYIDSVKDPAECYQQLYNAGIGTMVSDFYIAWAYCYDLVDNTRKADEIFRRGIACRAQPLEDLQEAHHHFGFTVAQRLMYKDDDNIKEETNRQLHERRLALSSLRGHRRKQLVGSTRTGAAVKNLTPGIVKVNSDGPSSSHQRNNGRVQVFSEENECPNANSTCPTTEPAETAVTNGENKSVVRSIMEAQRDQENLKEPGPWSRPHKKGKLFSKTKITNELGFEIHEDGNETQEEEYVRKPCVPLIPLTPKQSTFDKPFKMPPNFCAQNKPQLDWIIPVTTEEKPDRNTIPEYNKCKSYPRPNKEFQPEEFKAYVAFKKLGISNAFTKKRELYWGCGPNYNIRQYPHFAKQSNPQNLTDLDKFFVPQKISGLQLPFDAIYNEEEKTERQYEEILAMRIKRNETIIKITDMEETVCVSSERVERRKSFYPVRKSMAPCASGRGGTRKVSIMTASAEENEEESVENEEQTTSSNQSCTPAIFEDRETIDTPKLLSKLSRQRDPESSKPKDRQESETPEILPILPGHTEVEAPKETQAQSSEAFTIFQDESFVAKPKGAASADPPRTVLTNDEFQFKTPALPTNVNPPPGIMAKPNKIHFEIFEDNAAKSDTNCGSGGYFDPDESCSTQTFNIFLRAQSVSTPKPKPEPQRQFGNILKETVMAPPTFDQKEEEPQPVTTIPVMDHSDENCPLAVPTVFSPQRKQLSTILETSENGTTQSTQTTTGATTKSMISSPEFDQESQAQTMTANHHVPTLDTVRERTFEGSSDTVEEKLSSMKMGDQSKVDKNNSGRSKINSPPCTPGMVRSEPVISKCNRSGGLDFSIFEDPIEKVLKNVGNFSRLEEKEDTATGYAIKPVHFQEDKTETIPKMLLAPSQPVKFQEDKTETISAMLLAPPPPIKFQEDKTETISKMLLAPFEPARYQEDKTETISKFLLPPPHPASFEDDRTEALPKLPVKENNVTESRDDLFEFFSQSPPKLGRATNCNPLEKGQHAHIRTAAENRTPLTIDSKRFCDKFTPDMQIAKTKRSPLFANEAPTNSKSVLRDSFMSDFTDIQQKPLPLKTVKPKSVLRDSFMPDFSLIEDSQPQKQQQRAANESYLPDLSHVPESQPAIKNYSFIPDSQPMHSTSGRIRQENPTKNTLQSSYLPDFSCIPETQQPLSNTNEGQPSGLKNILTDTFMKDFSAIKEPPPIPMDVKEMAMLQPSKNNSTLKYLEESMSHKSISNTPSNNSIQIASTASKESKLSSHPPKPEKTPIEGKQLSESEKFFELNAETEMFGTNISMIKNSTWLPNHGPTKFPSVQSYQIQVDSIHIKDELPSSSSLSASKRTQDVFVPPKAITGDLPRPKLSFLNNSSNVMMNQSRFSIDVSQSEIDAIYNAKKQHQQSGHTKSNIVNEDEDGDFGEMSIYINHTPKTPKAQVHVWDVEDSESSKYPANNRYTHAETDLNQTLQILENVRMDPNVNPFSVDLINAFLDQIQFTNYIKNIPHCMLVGCIHRLKAYSKIVVNSVGFEVTKLIGEGAYGAVFLGKEVIGGKKVALKQEKPANLWEYYICLEIQDRIRIDEMLPAFMSVEYALIGNNCSVLISQFSQYGSLITVCNKIKKHTLKNVDEYVVMVMACELLETMDHLHAISIIHADIKADNFLLMNKLQYPSKERSLQLIDFGVSIDMKLFKPNQTFSYVHTDNTFKCVEMREQRPWTYQLDLYGLAGVLHVLLFGKYMDIARKPSGIWMHKTHVPRYFNRNLWETIFKALLNIRDCNSMPNLQGLRALLKEEIEEKVKYVTKMVNEFNRVLDM